MNGYIFDYNSQRKQKGPCGKIIFDKKTAQTKRNFLMRRGNEKELRIYQCPMCNGAWHLTKTKLIKRR